jgi:uncharacterized SAM-binding protein YcdF (DUF218 family)
MFFGLSKLFWFVCAPSHIAVWLVLAAAILIYLKRVRAAHWCAAISAAILIVFGFTPVSLWLMQPLENAYPRPPLPQHIDGILILGGGTDGEIFASRGVINPNHGLTRLAAGYQLAREHPEARVVFTGGPFPLSDPRSEALAAQKILTGLGLPKERLTLEANSLNTWENFVFSRQLVKPKDGETWVLVTSAFHMPRAMRIASKVKWKMIPWPSDYLTGADSHFEYTYFVSNQERADLAIHEAIGLAVYRLTGKAH